MQESCNYFKIIFPFGGILPITSEFSVTRHRFMQETVSKKVSCVCLKYGQRYNKCQAILESNTIKSIKSIITRRGENYERSKAILSAITLNSYDISFIEKLKKTQYLDLNQSGMLMKFHLVS